MKRTQSLLILLLLVSVAGCLTKPAQTDPSNSLRKEIDRERAIEIAHTQVKFQVKSVIARKATDKGHPVWRVTFRGEPVSEAHPMSEIMIVLVNRKTGEIVSIAQS